MRSKIWMKPRRLASSPQSTASQVDRIEEKLYITAQENLDYVKNLLHSPLDLTVRQFKIPGQECTCGIVCIEGLTEENMVNKQVLEQIFHDFSSQSSAGAYPYDLVTFMVNELLSVVNIEKILTMTEAIDGVLAGNSALFIDGQPQALLIGSHGGEVRPIEEPKTEELVRGPRDGFTEKLQTNLALIRRRLKDPNLRLESFKMGRRSKMDLVIAYIEGVSNPSLVSEVRRRVQSIDMDDVLESGYVEQWIEDSFLSPFPQIQNTERPDKAVAELVQGKVVILLDGTPFVLIAPIVFINLIQSPEDYYERIPIGSLWRILRLIATMISVFLPGLVVALVEFHQGMIPTKLALSIAGTREGIPFPAIIELLLMEVTMELLREAGIRLPRPLGQTIGIVGGLVIGDAAVSAGIVSPIMVIVVALTAIASFAIPAYSISISFRLLRFSVIAAAAVFGFLGLILSFICIMIHMVNLRSFGIPYTTTIAPSLPGDYKDILIRAPIRMMKKRPQYLQTTTEKRQQGGERST